MAEGGPTTLLFVEQTNVRGGATIPANKNKGVVCYVVKLISLWFARLGVQQTPIYSAGLDLY